ncbi:protein FAM18B1 [Trypanosoma rangeli]|uniref:Golgi apparatus membrane protein TVP23 homolog n=1 Tax=Trypanosoma rangeli TaxID=5698 RepID=A0A3R7KD75_TRYRA|nr:protein FAM18B1 [Trypanosoma rangeli]RNF05724.1 protein FAM18B1 [Trypanosoma rangeli]|eukprot:RNF05724.1 protein FAM18B1 [Trypanosoma rangeli]
MLEPSQPNFDFFSPSPMQQQQQQQQQPAPSQAQFMQAPHISTGGNAMHPPTGFGSSGVSPPPLPPPAPQSDDRVYKGAHPFVAFFHVAFKAGALLTFILGSLLISSYVTIFVATILFLAADFWVTKNVSGRLLVCLRWWNEVKEDGSTCWIFESAPDADARVNAFDKWFFWITTGGNFGVWVLLVIFNVMSSRLPMTVIGAVLGGANFIGFLKCSRDAKKRVTQFMLGQAAQQHNLVREAAGVF